MCHLLLVSVSSEVTVPEVTLVVPGFLVPRWKVIIGLFGDGFRID